MFCASVLIACREIITSAVAADISTRVANFNSAASSIQGDFTSKVGSKADAITSGIASLNSAATARVGADYSKITQGLDSKWSTVKGWTSVKDDINSAVAKGTTAVDAFFATQKAIASDKASAIKADAASSLNAAASSLTATPVGTAATTSASAGAGNKVVVGTAVGLVGLLACVIALQKAVGFLPE